jgi:SAM-dependent methyltransferase
MTSRRWTLPAGEERAYSSRDAYGGRAEGEGRFPGVIGGALGYRLLRMISSRGRKGHLDGSAYSGGGKLEFLFGPQIWSELEGKAVIGFGCGAGADLIKCAQRGVRRAIGIDIRESVLAEARLAAERAGVSDRCLFTTSAEEKVDVIMSINAFEHFSDPGEVLRQMRELLKDDGRVLAAFGPTWYHPLGGHLFSVFPWAHLVFTEEALIRWRSDFKTDGAKRFGEVDGGLNQMTIRRFERLVAESEFRFDTFEAVPIRRLRLFATPLTREFFTSFVRCRLTPQTGGRHRGH